MTTRGTPDRTVDETRGMPDVGIEGEDILTSSEHDDINHDSNTITGVRTHRYARTAISTSTTISSPDRIIGCTAHSITITLASAMLTEGAWLIINDESGGAGGVGQAITIDTEGSETIDGASSITLNGNFDAVFLYSDGSNWFSAATKGTL